MRARISEVREVFIPEVSFPDGRGFVVLDTGDVVELIVYSPWADSLDLVLASDKESDCLDGTHVSRHSTVCRGLQVVDIFKCETIPSIGLALSDQTAVFMDADLDSKMSVFHSPLSDYILEGATSWLSGSPF